MSPTILRPGDSVRASGIYKVLHPAHDSDDMRVFISGQELPSCPVCGHDAGYLLVQSAPSAFEDPDFAARLPHAGGPLRGDGHRVSAELRAWRRLGEVGSLARVDPVQLGELVHVVLAAAIELTEADFGNVQLLESSSASLTIYVQHGFEKEFLEYFNHVHGGEYGCGSAMARGRRFIVEDVASNPAFSDESREVMLRAGAASCQSTPLFSSSGKLVGMVSTHYRGRVHPPAEGLRRLDLMAERFGKVLDGVHPALLSPERRSTPSPTN